jgi:DNA adenine methylase
MMDVPILKVNDGAVLRYLGSKWKLADWVIGQFPPHNRYIEPFCGSASVFFRKAPVHFEVLNDMDGNIVNFFQQLRDNADAFIRAIELTPYSRAEYELSYQPTDDPLEKARRFYVRCWQSFAANSRGKPTGWRIHKNVNDNQGDDAHTWQRLDSLQKACKRLKNAHIEHDDAIEVIKRYDAKDAVIYLDPPYVHETRSSKRRYEGGELTNDMHVRLSEVAKACKASVFISGYDSPFYRELYAGWRCISTEVTTNGSRPNQANKRVEYLWISPKADSLHHYPLFRGGISEDEDI